MLLLHAFAISVLAQNPASVPEPGQFTRYRAAPRGSLLSLVPVDGAEFLPGQRFDISIELHKLSGGNSSFPSVAGIDARINGQPLEDAFSKQFSTDNWVFQYHENAAAFYAHKSTNVSVTRLALRSVSLGHSGDFSIQVRVGSEIVDAHWRVRDPGNRLVKNVVLFIGDGMAPTMMNAARYLSRPTTFGKFGSNFLNIEKLGTIGKITTNGIDSIITDSANSAAAYNTGQKSWCNNLNVYMDTSPDTLDDPKVESLAEFIRSNRPGMCIGVVTTAEVQDATPAAVYSHTRSRDDKASITEQNLNGLKHQGISWDPKPVKADVLLGGGGAYFCAKKENGKLVKNCKPLNGSDYYQLYRDSGYTVVNSKTEFENFHGNGPLVGIFHLSHMDSWIDRNVYPENLNLNKKNPDGSGKSATDMPGLESMVMKAVDILSSSPKCTDGFYLMAEAAAVDKQMHNMDYDRSLGELLELDRTVKRMQDWAKANGDNTGIIVTADHSQAFDVYGTVDTRYFNSQPIDGTGVAPGLDAAQQRLQIQKRLAVGVYENAGWPNLVIDEQGMPTKWESQYRLAQGKVDKTPHRENFQITKVPETTYSPMSRILTVEDPTLSKLFGFTVSVENPKVTDGIHVGATTNSEMTNTVHSMQAVDLYCGGPARFTALCAKIMDNTELFFIMAHGLGLGATGTGAQIGPIVSAGEMAIPSLVLLVLAFIY